MYGSVIGNIAAIIYFVFYQLSGIIIADYLFNKENPYIRILIGSVIGSFLLEWLPLLPAYLTGFSITSHIIGLCLLIAILLIVVLIISKNKKIDLLVSSESIRNMFKSLKNNLVITALFLIFSCLFAYLLYTHVLLVKSDGIWCGQCTYGDMNMHLGFITSIAKQGFFPPEYSIMPGEMMGYPFLCDSISSSLYIWGSSLKIAYCIPMMFAFFQVMGGIYAFANVWLKDKAKSIITFLLFLLDGGLGFLYFLNIIGPGGYSIPGIFKDFYKMPTNLVDENLRWVNVINDMLLPQRATLFGWAVLFTLLFIIFRAVFEKQKKYFYVAGVLAGGLVMIHTHSFLALAIICAVWFMYDLINKLDFKITNKSFSKNQIRIFRAIFIIVSLSIMSIFSVIKSTKREVDLSRLWFLIAMTGLLIFVIFIIYLLVKLGINKKLKNVLSSWGVFLAIVLPLALIQLVQWTFKQATGSNFVRGWFNWINMDDQYIVFYLKNIGLVMIFIIIALIFEKKKNFRIMAAGLAIWFIGEFLEFQPNDYDNNKLLLVGYFLLLIPAASLMVDLFRRIKYKVVAVILAVITMVVCTASGVLTIGREVVSEYNVYGNDYKQLCDYINESTVPNDAVILTNNNHNNAVASLTGRNIVVGSSTFLYFHGFDISERKTDIGLMFEHPADNIDLFKEYNVGYVVVGPFEYSEYDIDSQWFIENGITIYDEGNMIMMKLNID